jgi:arsenite methyltransferase
MTIKCDDKDVALRTSSQGHCASEGAYLEGHFKAAKAEYETMMRFVEFQPGWTVLDAGAGGGSFLPLLSELLGVKGIIHSIDLAPENVNMIQSRAHSGEFACSVKSQVASVTSLPFKDNTFDAIWCANVFQYLTDDEVKKALQEFRRVTVQNGLIAIKETDASASLFMPDPFAQWRLFEKARVHPSYKDWIHGLFRAAHLPNWLEHYGLSFVSYKTFLSEWRYPLKEIDLPHLKAIFTGLAKMVSDLDLSDEESTPFRRIMDVSAPDYFLNSPDFYMRSPTALILGKVPKQ